MASSKHKWWHIGVALYMVLGCAGNALNMPCCAEPEAASAFTKEDEAEMEPGESHGTSVRVEFIKGFNSAYVLEGQGIAARLMEDLKTENGGMLAPKGSKIYGRIKLVNRSKGLIKSAKSKEERWNRRASVEIRFDKVVTPQKARLEIFGTPTPQYSIFSNGESVRSVMVGANGELLKTEDTQMTGMPEFGMMIPKDWIKLRGRYEVDVKPGDELVVHIDLGPHGDVQGEIVGGKPSSKTQ